MPKCTGLISHQDDDGLLYVFIPGRDSDLVIDQKTVLDGEHRLHVGDFVSFLDVNGSIKSPVRINKLFETRFRNNRLQVNVSVAFPPEEFCEQANLNSSIYKAFAWSPDFALVGCSQNVSMRLCPNQMYKAWIERDINIVENVAGIFVSWQIADVSDECDEQNMQLITKAPWNREKNRQVLRNMSCFDCPPKMEQRKICNRREFVASLKKYIDNYEGFVIAVHDSSAIVWSLAIPDSEVVFFLGGRKGLEVGDWIRFNCTSSVQPYLNCHLQGKKFEIIEPVLPIKAFNNTVQAEIGTTVEVRNLKYYPTGEVTLETDVLGPVEFGSRKFRQNYCGRYLLLIVSKNTPSKRTGAIWQVLRVVNEECVESTRNSNSIVNFSNKNGNPTQEFVSTRVECYAKVEIDNDCHFAENKLQLPDSSSNLPNRESLQKEVDDSYYSDSAFNNNQFDNRGVGQFENHGVKSLKTEEENDPLAELAFGALQPRVLQDSTSTYGNDVNGFETPGNFSTYPNKKSSENPKELEDSRAIEYWKRAWQIPKVRQQIQETDRVLFANVMQLMMDVNARNDNNRMEIVRMSKG